MAKITVIGSANTDMVVKSERIPSPGETVLGGQFLMNPGGKGANQAVAAARMGGSVTFITKVGDDFFGRDAVASWRREKIDTSYVRVDPGNPSGAALILVDRKGENCIAVAPGANAALRPEDLAPAREVIESADMLLMQLEIPVETVLCAARWAAARRIPVILNPAPAVSLPDALFPALCAITPNETEAEILTGIRVTDEASAREAGLILHRRGVKNVVITMGKQGAWASCAEFQEMIPARPVKAVDTTAAGDVFNGTLAVALAEHLDFRAALQLASKAASVSVTRQGAQSSAPFRNEMENI